MSQKRDMKTLPCLINKKDCIWHQNGHQQKYKYGDQGDAVGPVMHQNDSQFLIVCNTFWKSNGKKHIKVCLSQDSMKNKVL